MRDLARPTIMPRKKTEFERAAGKLISAIQKEWGDDLGLGSRAEFSMNVMSAAHKLLQARTPDEARKLIGPVTVRQYLGEVWIQGHSSVKPAVAAIESLLGDAASREESEIAD